MANVTIYLNELGEPFIDLINESGNVIRTCLDEDMAEAIGLIRIEQGYEVNGEEYSIPHEEANEPTNAATARATMPINVQETATENGPKCRGNGNVGELK